METYIAPFYTEEQLRALDESQVHFPYSDKWAKYNGLTHQYELTKEYFEENGVSIFKELETQDIDKVNNFLKDLSRKVYLFIYSHSKSTRQQLNYLIAKRSLRGYSPYEYRKAFLDTLFIEGCYLLANGDLSMVSGVDLDTMQNMSEDVMRNQDRDFCKDCVRALRELGLTYYGRYHFAPQGKDW